MSTFEYLSVLLSIIVGVGITHVIMGLCRLISHTSGRRIYSLIYAVDKNGPLWGNALPPPNNAPQLLRNESIQSIRGMICQRAPLPQR
jgi:hypothetical protein